MLSYNQQQWEMLSLRNVDEGNNNQSPKQQQSNNILENMFVMI